MSTSAFGETMESKNKRLHVEIVRTREELLAQTNKLCMKTYKIFDNQLTALSFNQRKIY